MAAPAQCKDALWEDIDALATLPFLAGASSLAKKLNWLAMAAWLLRIAGCYVR